MTGHVSQWQGHVVEVVGSQGLDWMILEVFSSPNDSMILQTVEFRVGRYYFGYGLLWEFGRGIC